MRLGLAVTRSALAAMMAVIACVPSTPGFDRGYESIEQLVHGYLDAVVAGDTGAMHAFRVSEMEHTRLLWPHFPASRPETGYTAEFAYANLDRRSRRDALRIVDDVAGRTVEAIGVRCRDSVEVFGPVRVHADCTVTLRDSNNGGQAEAKLFGSVAELHGQYKIIGILSD